MDSTTSSNPLQTGSVSVLPTMTITSRTPVPSNKTWVAGTVTIVDGGRTILSGNLQIKLRGNYTATLPKKPYKIKLEHKAKLFDMSNDKDWALMANALDKTLTSTALAMSVGQASTKNYALPWTPKSKFVDLTLNGTYVGVYQLMETVQLNGERLDGPEVQGDTGLSSTGTYLMEINHQGGPYDYTSPNGVTIIFDNPDRETITAPQANYITDFLKRFETLLFKPDPAWKRMVNLQSFATWYIIEELASNQDSAFNGSCYCYKMPDTTSAEGRLYMGPLWDFDISFGNTVNEQHAPDVYYVRDPAGHWGQKAVWILEMFKDAEYVSAVKAAWQDLKAHLISSDGSGLITAMNNISNSLGDSAARNKALWQNTWPSGSVWSWTNPTPPLPTKAEWIQRRVAFLNSKYNQ